MYWSISSGGGSCPAINGNKLWMMIGRLPPNQPCVFHDFIQRHLAVVDPVHVSLRAGIELDPDFVLAVKYWSPSCTSGKSSPVPFVIRTILKKG